MDALVPAFVAALLVGVSDRPARLAALLGTGGRFAPVFTGFVLGHAAAIALSIAGAFVLAPMLAPGAKSLLLAIALILAGLGVLWHRAPRPAAGHRFVGAASGAFVAGDGTAFLAFALAVKGSAPVLAGIGALAGALAIAGTAAATGSAWERLPLIVIGRVASFLLILIGLVIALGAMRLI